MFIVDVFNRAVVDTGRPMTDRLLRLDADRLFRIGDPDLFKRRAERFLSQAERVGHLYPDMTTKWATYVASLSELKRLSVTNDAVKTVLAYAEPAFALKPAKLRNDLATCWLATQSRQLRREIVAMRYHLEPLTIPGPWGIREEGLAYLDARREREKSLSERLGDLKHRILHPPGPDSITIYR